jgi:hypothetical protein
MKFESPLVDQLMAARLRKLLVNSEIYSYITTLQLEISSLLVVAEACLQNISGLCLHEVRLQLNIHASFESEYILRRWIIQHI